MPLTKIDDRGLTTPIDLLDNEQIRLGTGNDLRIYHNGTHSYIEETGQGRLNIATNQLNVTSANSSETLLNALENGAVSLYYDNDLHFATTNLGCKTNGDLSFQGDGGSEQILFDASDNSLKFVQDQVKLKIGAGNDLQIYHDGTDSYCKNSTGQLKFLINDNENAIVAHPNSGVELYADNSKKFETGSLGARFFGNLYASDNYKILLGNSQDLQIYHDGSHSYIYSDNGELKNRAAIWKVVNEANSEIQIKATENAAVELYYDHSKKFETDANGVTVTGRLASSTNISATTYVYSGGQVYSDDLITATQHNSSILRLKTRNASGTEQTLLKGTNGAAVELYHNNGLKFFTGTNGIYFPNHGTLHEKAIHFDASGSGDYGTLFGATNYPDNGGYTGQNAGHWARIQAKGGCVVVINSDASNKNDGRNDFDHFSIYQRAGESTNGKRLFSVDGEGSAQFGRAGIRIDNGWAGQPSLTMQRNNNDGTDNTNDAAYMRVHGSSATHESWTGGAGGADFAANFLIDGSTYGTSDRRAKTDIVDCPYGLDVVNKLQPRKYQLINSALEPQGPDNINLGFIAQEIKEHIPECVNYLGDEANIPNDKGWARAYALDIGEVIPVLVKAIQELSTKVAALEAK